MGLFLVAQVAGGHCPGTGSALTRRTGPALVFGRSLGREYPWSSRAVTPPDVITRSNLGYHAVTMVSVMATQRRRHIDPDAREPKYRQLAGILREQIIAGEIPPGRRVPSQEELIQQHEISVRTVDSAMKILKAERLVEAETGKGLFVLAPSEWRLDAGEDTA